MSKVAIVYWSGTGNTEAMACSVEAGAKAQGAETALYTAAALDGAMKDECDAVAFGCPSMGDEELEETEFAPMFAGCTAKLSGKKIALFGSYGRGDVAWMRDWADTCVGAGAVMACDFVICNDAPDDDATAACEALGGALA